MHEWVGGTLSQPSQSHSVSARNWLIIFHIGSGFLVRGNMRFQSGA